MSGAGDEHTADAIALLRAEHRQVEAWFEEFQCCTSLRREHELALLICNALRRHAAIDTSVFYPAFLAATGDEYKFESMLRDDRDIGDLIDEIEASSPSEDSFSAKIHILCSMFGHHVRQEEKDRGVFTEAVNSGLDVGTLGRELQERQSTMTAPPELRTMTHQ